MEEILAYELEDDQLDIWKVNEDDNSQKVTTAWHRNNQMAILQSLLTVRGEDITEYDDSEATR